jgi:hypothetical protein
VRWRWVGLHLLGRFAGRAVRCGGVALGLVLCVGLAGRVGQLVLVRAGLR